VNKKYKLIISLIIILLTISYFSIKIIMKDENKKIISVNEQDKIHVKEINYQEEIEKIKKEYDNNDIVGILTVENTDFKEIVVQYTDNDYYLNHDINNIYNKEGQAFLDYRFDINNSKKLIIYGHNAPDKDIPFKFFENYHNSNYFEKHKYLYLQTDKGIKKYEIFSVYIEVSDWSYFNKIDFANKEEYYKHLLKLKSKSFYDTGVDINEEDNILIIQTCSYHYDYTNYENKFLLIIGKQI